MELRLKDYPALVSAFELLLDPLDLPANASAHRKVEWYDDMHHGNGEQKEHYAELIAEIASTQEMLNAMAAGNADMHFHNTINDIAMAEIEQLMNKWAQPTKRFRDDLLNG